MSTVQVGDYGAGGRLNQRRKVALFSLVAVLLVAAVLGAISFYPRQPSTFLVVQPGDTVLESANRLVVPPDQSNVIVEGEQASFKRGSSQVNVTVVRAVNESLSRSMFSILRSGYLAQGLSEHNLTISEFASRFSATEERPLIILASKGEFLATATSYDETLALDAIQAQLARF